MAPRYDVKWQEDGKGKPVILIHGLGMDRHMWKGQVDGLSQRYRVITYDNLGHGQTEKPPGPYSLTMFADLVRDVADKAGAEIFALVGFSLGGMIAQTFALTHPDRLGAAVIMNAVYNRTPEESAAVRARADAIDAEGPNATVDAAIERWLTPEFRKMHPEVEAAIRKRVTTNDHKAYAAAYRVFAEGDPELTGRLGAIRCPTLVITAEHDKGSNPRMAREMAEAIPGATLEILPHLRHLAPMEGVAQMNAALLSFLAEAYPP
jgi:3-oxoadipate enol-lactonase